MSNPANSNAIRSQGWHADEVETLMPRSHIGELESIRGIAALLIVMFHAPGWNTGKEYIGVIQNGYLMVDLFFVLSGFVIYKAYGAHLTTFKSVWRFQFLRWGRLYPVHLFFLLFFLVTLSAPWRDLKVAFVQQLFLVQAIGPTGNAISFNYPAWSISTEFYTYFLFALIVWGTSKVGGHKNKKFTFVSCCAIGFLSWISLFVDELYGFRDLVRCFAGFFIGCMTAGYVLWVERHSFHSKGLSPHWPNWIAPSCFIAICLFLEFKHSKDLSFDPAIYILTSLLIIALVFSSQGWFKRLLMIRPLLWLGEISYSLYMAHLACIFLCEGVLRGLHKRFVFFVRLEEALGIHLAYPASFFDGLIKYGFFFVVLLFVSSASYYLLERPCREASRRWIHRSKLISP